MNGGRPDGLMIIWMMDIDPTEDYLLMTMLPLTVDVVAIVRLYVIHHVIVMDGDKRRMTIYMHAYVHILRRDST